jgi:hypothetical protein
MHTLLFSENVFNANGGLVDTLTASAFVATILINYKFIK